MIYTRPKWEKKVASLLQQKGIGFYCPLNRVRRQWKDRKKLIHEPLFKGYVFVQIEDSEKWNVLKVNGVINYVHIGSKPAIVRETEIVTIKKFLNEFEDVEVVDYQLEKNQEVVIKSGVLMDYKGIILEVTGNKAKISIESMGLKLSATFNTDQLVPVDNYGSK